MDDPALDELRHVQALEGLSRINRLSRSAALIWPELKKLAGTSSRPIRVLDLATGGGDIPLALWRKAQRAGIAMQFAGCDKSATAIRFAQSKAEAAGANIDFFPLDIFANKGSELFSAAENSSDPFFELPRDYDAIICSLFLHHLGLADAVQLLARMKDAARQLIVINDLERSTPALLLALAATRLFTRSEIVRVDGPLSVRAGFTIPEARALAVAAGCGECTIRRRWPFRFVLSWRRDPD